MRKPLIAGNWKMFKTVPEARGLVGALRASLDAEPAAGDVLVAPPFTALHAVAAALAGSRIGVAAQDMHHEKEGAFTGEVSATMLKDAGCSHVILGHSERRHLFGEGDDAVGRKARAAWDNGLVPIVCVGETQSERDSNRTLEVVERQLERGLRQLRPEEAARSVVAYEPVWAIGTGRVATPAEAEEVHRAIRKLVRVSHGDDVAAALRVLYGGSVKPENAAALLEQDNIDGALVGGACLVADSFLKIIRAA
jgi:triosephosphate isomerase